MRDSGLVPSPFDDLLTDLTSEYDRIGAMLGGLGPEQWHLPSAAPGWSVADTVLHLALTEEGVPATLSRPGDTEWTRRDRPLDNELDDQIRSFEIAPAVILRRWQAARRASVEALSKADPTQLYRWAAAPLRPRTLATTRLAEHWAHALDIADPLGLPYEDDDRLRHVAWLGHATVPYAMRLHGLEPVELHCTLTMPSGAIFTLGPGDATNTITGSLGAFCRVGARRLPAEESGLMTAGPAADLALLHLRNYAV